MATALKRYNLTEVPELRGALAVARAAWPDETSATKLIYRLASLGADQVRRETATARQARARLAEELAGRYPAVPAGDYLADLRREWDR